MSIRRWHFLCVVLLTDPQRGGLHGHRRRAGASHARQELEHALLIAKQIDYLGGMPAVAPKPVKVSKNAEEMLRIDLENENETVRNYRERVRQCEALGELRACRAHPQADPGRPSKSDQTDLAAALGKDVPDVTSPRERA